MVLIGYSVQKKVRKSRVKWDLKIPSSSLKIGKILQKDYI